MPGLRHGGINGDDHGPEKSGERAKGRSNNSERLDPRQRGGRRRGRSRGRGKDLKCTSNVSESSRTLVDNVSLSSGSSLPWRAAALLANGAVSAALRIIIGGAGEQTMVDTLLEEHATLACDQNPLHFAARAGNAAAVAIMAMAASAAGARRAALHRDCIGRLPEDTAIAAGQHKLAGQLR